MVELPGIPPRMLPVGASDRSREAIGEWFMEAATDDRLRQALLEAIVDNASLTSTAHLRTLHEVALGLAAATTGDALNQLEDAEVDWASLKTFDDLMQCVYETADALG